MKKLWNTIKLNKLHSLCPLSFRDYSEQNINDSVNTFGYEAREEQIWGIPRS